MAQVRMCYDCRIRGKRSPAAARTKIAVQRERGDKNDMAGCPTRSEPQ